MKCQWFEIFIILQMYFKRVFIATEELPECGQPRVVVAYSFRPTTVVFPISGDYPVNAQCSWHITAGIIDSVRLLPW